MSLVRAQFLSSRTPHRSLGYPAHQPRGSSCGILQPPILGVLDGTLQDALGVVCWHICDELSCVNGNERCRFSIHQEETTTMMLMLRNLGEIA